jgi:serine/threonine-protein kinase RsbT
MHVTDLVRISVASDADIIVARQAGRELAGQIGFAATDLTMIATAVSELARNILLYAGQGEIEIRPECGDHGRDGIVVVAGDRGPGIRDVDQAMQIGYSTSGGLGLGLPGVLRLMGEMKVESKPGEGTVVTARKWRR